MIQEKTKMNLTPEEVKQMLDEYFRQHTVEELLNKIYSDEIENQTKKINGVHPVQK